MPRTDREALIEIGNLIGGPVMTYFPPIEIKEWRERARKVSAIVIEQLKRSVDKTPSSM